MTIDPSRDAVTLSHIAALAYQPPLPPQAPVFSLPDRRVEATVATNTGSQQERQGTGDGRPRDQFTSSGTGITVMASPSTATAATVTGLGHNLDTFG